MKVVKKTDEHTIFQKRNGRYGVRDAEREWINGDDKTRILLDAGLIETKLPQPSAEPEAADTGAEETQEDDDAAAETQDEDEAKGDDA